MPFSSTPASSLVSLPPGPITFRPLPAASSIINITIANKTARAIAYKLKTNNQDRYSARPNMGVLPVGNSVDASVNSTNIELSVNALPSPPADAGASCRDKFYFLFTPWPSGEGDVQQEHAEVAAFWNRTDKATVSQEEIAVVLDMDAYDASDRSRISRGHSAESQLTSPSAKSHFLTGVDGDPTRRGSVVGSGRSECIICMDNPATQAFTPCGHHCACNGCAATIIHNGGRQSTCPVCRAPVDGRLRIYM